MEYEFEPKEWVLCRDGDKEEWRLDIFSHKNVEYGDYICIGMRWNYCIPYEGNEQLLGTKNKPTEWNVGDKVEVQNADDDKWYDGEIVKLNTKRDEGFHYSVEAECFHCGPKWCRADQLRKPKAEEGWRPKKGEAIEAEYDGEWHSAVLILDDRTTLPYRVRLDSGETVWTSEDSVRPARKKKDEPYRFGDEVQCKEDGEWMDGLFIMDDHTTIRYLVYLPSENDTVWVREEDIRRA